MLRRIILLALIGAIIFSTGCLMGSPPTGSPPPEFTVSNPNVVPDGSGGFIIAYQVNKGHDRTTYVQRLGAEGNALWGKKGTALYSDPGGFLGSGERACAPLVSDGKGGVIVIWPSEDTLWAQKLDTEGHSLWQAGSVQISGSGTYKLSYKFKAVSDNSGGAIVGWAGSNDNIYLQRIDSEGNLLWNKDISIPEVKRLDLASDSSGNALFIWGEQEAYKDGDVFVQKLDSSGQCSWTPGGLLLSDIHGPGYTGCEVVHGIISDGAGGAIVAWIQDILSEDKRSIIGQNLYAQRISAEGEILWEPGGVAVGHEGQVNSQYEPRIISDGSGGYIIFWKSSVVSIHAQRLDSAGSALWPESGIQVWQGKEPLYYDVTDDGSGGAAIVWNYTDKGRPVLRAQRLNAAGAKRWGDNGILVSTVSPYYSGYSTPALISQDGYGGFIVSWAAGKNMHKASSSYVQRIDSEGKLLWGEKGIRLDE